MSAELLALFSTNNIILFIIVLTRLSGFFVSAPLFSTYPVPNQVKVWLCATIAFLIYPFLANQGNITIPTSIPVLASFLALEFAIGFLLGYVAKILFMGVQLSGHVISMQMGLSVAETLDPTSGNQAPALGTLYVYIISLIFLAVNAHLYLFAAIYQSFNTIPIGQEFVFSPEFVHSIVVLMASIFAIAIKVVMPVFAVMFSVEVLMAVVAKSMPQMNIFMVSLPFKIIVGLVVMLVFLSPTMTYMVSLIEDYTNQIMQLLLG